MSEQKPLRHQDLENLRHLNECRYWLGVTGGFRANVDALIARLAAQRGKAAAERVREGMREVYAMKKSAAEALDEIPRKVQ